MRKIVPTLVYFSLLSASLATIHFDLVAPQDLREARQGVQSRPELKPLLDEYCAIIKGCLLPLKLDDVAKTFGPKLDTATNWWGYYGGRSGPELNHHPADLALPVFFPGGMMVSGLHTGNSVSDKSHADLHAIGDIGYVEFYYQLNGESVNNAAIYFRADDKFVPLKSINDFSKRLDWHEGKLNALKNWIDRHLVLATDSKRSSANATTAPTK
jgi:hypothetical protein